jgi:hypothetical protein
MEHIQFQQTRCDSGDLLHELTDPGLLRARTLSTTVANELRRGQIAKLQENIRILRAKQAEFNAKMEQYVANLERLMDSIQRSIARELARSPTSAGSRAGTHVRCQGCQQERTFPELEVIFARESDESLNLPTQCYVSDQGRIKKGVFSCRRCGSEHLTIRPQA